ncbi:MAG: hypothetical protein FJX64_01905 [Alphaproteobacteria bacterium]|nr:hypothetical protein [Alphaproteobacteria bacterium]
MNVTPEAANFVPVVVPAGIAFEVHAGKRRLSVKPGIPLQLPGQALAGAICEEWQAAGPQARMADLRLARLAIAAVEAAAARANIEAALLAYVHTDLVCYWSAEDAPLALRVRQATAWQPMLNWANQAFGVRLRVTHGIVPAQQDETTVARIGHVIAATSPAELIALRLAGAAAGSLIIGLGLLRGAWGVDEAYAASTVDEAYQMERWGTDAEAEVSLAARRTDLGDAVRFLKLCNAA